MAYYPNDRILEVRNDTIHLCMCLSSICLFVMTVKLNDRQSDYIGECNKDKELKAGVSQRWHDSHLKLNGDDDDGGEDKLKVCSFSLFCKVWRMIYNCHTFYFECVLKVSSGI